MSAHSVTIPMPCPRCVTTLDWHVVARSGRVVRVSTSFACTNCGLTQEADGSTLPVEVRNAFIATEGRWVVLLDDLGPRRAEVVRLLKDTYDLAPTQVLDLVRNRRPLSDATLVEAESIAELLGEFGAVVSLSRAV
jgi:hypothetical protein